MTTPMTKTIKRIGLLTSGGDCPGLNAAIRGVTLRALQGYGWEVLGIHHSTNGLLESPPRVRPLTLEDVDIDMMRRGGTILGALNKGSNPLAWPMPDGTIRDRSDEVINTLQDLGVDALVCIGGDGSFSILSRVLRDKMPFVGIPKTIDNDVGQTGLSIGFHSATAIATEALDRLQPTAASHERIMVLEVMGRDAGHIALESGIAGGADIILIPEIPWRLDAVARKIKSIRDSGRTYALVVVSEAVNTLSGGRLHKELVAGQKRYGGIGDYVAHMIAEATGEDTRATVLGHIQRGCPPAHTDRLIAQSFGIHAVDLLAEGKSGRMVAWRDRKVTDVPLTQAIASYQTVDVNGSLIRTARALGICLGDE